MASKYENHFLKRWRADFFAGLAIVMPAVISIGLVLWLFRDVSNITDRMLFFLPESLIRSRTSTGALGEIRWYWSVITLLWTVFLICLAGRYGRNYLGRQTIQWIDGALMRVPLMNKIYGTVKQVNESFSSNKSSFKQVVLVTFPHPNSRSVGFVTGEQPSLGNRKIVDCVHSDHAQPDFGLPGPGSGDGSHQAGYVRGRRHQVHYQPGRHFAGAGRPSAGSFAARQDAFFVRAMNPQSLANFGGAGIRRASRARSSRAFFEGRLRGRLQPPRVVHCAKEPGTFPCAKEPFWLL